MKKLENLNKDLFKGFEKKGISDLHKIYGGNVAIKWLGELGQRILQS